MLQEIFENIPNAIIYGLCVPDLGICASHYMDILDGDMGKARRDLS